MPKHFAPKYLAVAKKFEKLIKIFRNISHLSSKTAELYNNRKQLMKKIYIL